MFRFMVQANYGRFTHHLPTLLCTDCHISKNNVSNREEYFEEPNIPYFIKHTWLWLSVKHTALSWQKRREIQYIEIYGSHEGQDFDVGLLGCDAVGIYRYTAMKMEAVSSSETLVSTLKIEAVCSFEILESTFKYTPCYSSDQHQPHTPILRQRRLHKEPNCLNTCRERKQVGLYDSAPGTENLRMTLLSEQNKWNGSQCELWWWSLKGISRDLDNFTHDAPPPSPALQYDSQQISKSHAYRWHIKHPLLDKQIKTHTSLPGVKFA